MSNRNLEDYENNYRDKDHYDFEKFQVKYRRRNILELLKRNNHGRILEVGSGVDPLFSYLDDYNSYTVVEPSEEFFSIAKNLAGDDQRILLFHDYIENITVDEKYDFIVISSLLHEIENGETVLNAIKNLSHQGTVVYLNVPNAKSFHRLLALEAGIVGSIYNKSSNQIKFQQAHTYDIVSLEELVVACGFSVIESGSYFIKPFTHSQMRLLLAADIIGDDVLEGLDSMVKYCPDLGSEIFMTCKVN